MAFADFKPNFLKITDQSGKELGQVRALNEVDIGLLWQKHEEAMEMVFDAATNGVPDGEQALASAAVAAIRVAPALVTDIICLASGEPDWDATHAGVSEMPVGLRLELLGAVIRLSVEAEGGLGKLLGLFKILRPETAP